MSKKMILTISDELDNYIKTKAANLGMSKLDYIRFALTKEREQDDSYSFPIRGTGRVDVIQGK
jgi:hypothetical protein